MLDNHVRDIAAVDFFTVPTATFRILLCFIVLRHGRRVVVRLNVTTNPTAQWTAQQMIEAFPEQTSSRMKSRIHSSRQPEHHEYPKRILIDRKDSARDSP